MERYEHRQQNSLEYSANRPLYASASFWSLVIANLLVIVWAVLTERPLGLMVWVYFSQNVILGIFWPLKVFASLADSSYTKKVQSVAVFLPHYLVVHFGYGLCLYDFIGKELFTNFQYILTMAGIFLLSETVSYFAENSMNRTRPLSLAKVQFFPYARVIPMHFVVYVGVLLETGGVNVRLTVMLFLLLKAFADVAMYMVERSRVLGNLVTDYFERHKEKAFSSEYSNSKEEQEVCLFCQRVIGRNETPRVINENVVCEDCYKKIELEKKKTND